MFYRVIFGESFKDGNIFGSEIKLPKVEYIMTEAQYKLTVQSGAVIEHAEMVFKNPFVKKEEETVVEPIVEETKSEVAPPVEPEVPVKRKAGRPRKNAAS